MREPLIPARTRSADAQEDDEDAWVLDSSVRNHYIRCKKLFRNSYPCYDGKYKEGFSGMRSQIIRTGDAFLPSQGGENVKLVDVSCVPESVHNIISVSKLTTNFPFCVIFHSSGFVVKNLSTNKYIAKGQLHNNQYLWPKNEPKPNGGILSLFTSIHELLGFSKESSPEDHSDINNIPGLPSGLEFQEAWPKYRRINPRDVEHRNSWIMSSYATQHVTYDRGILRNLRALPQEILFQDFAGRTSPATHIGEAFLQCSGCQGIVLHEVLLIPDSTANYISVAQLTLEYPSRVEFRSYGFIVTSLEENRLIAVGPKHNGLYKWLNESKSIASSPGVFLGSLI